MSKLLSQGAGSLYRGTCKNTWWTITLPLHLWREEALWGLSLLSVIGHLIFAKTAEAGGDQKTPCRPSLTATSMIGNSGAPLEHLVHPAVCNTLGFGAKRLHVLEPTFFANGAEVGGVRERALGHVLSYTSIVYQHNDCDFGLISHFFRRSTTVSFSVRIPEMT